MPPGVGGPRTGSLGEREPHAVETEPADDPAPDGLLLERCRGRDAVAWDVLVARYERLVFSVAMRNGLDREDAADVTQTTFLALLDSIGELRDGERLASWLMTVSRRQAWRVRRRRERDREDGQAVAEVADPTEEWASIASVHEALSGLPQPCRELLRALYFDPEMPSYAEVASRLGRQIGGIGPMRARCLQRMRTLLGEEIAGGS